MNTFIKLSTTSSSIRVNVCNINEESVKSFNFLSYFFLEGTTMHIDASFSSARVTNTHPVFSVSVKTSLTKKPMKKSALFDRKGKMPLQRFFKRKKRAKSAVSRINSYLITLAAAVF